MSKRTKDEKAYPDTQKKQKRIKATSGGSSVDADSGRVFPDAESENSSTEETLDSPSENADNMDTPTTSETSDTWYKLFTMVTQELAKLDRDRQGHWEAEYSYGGEVDLHRHYDHCTKNPGHKNFIPVDKFSIEDLPERYSDNDMVDYIKAVSDLTVRVTVKYVSERRPKTIVVRGKHYQGYRYKGQRRTTVGTGWVQGVANMLDEIGQTCKCKDCRKSSTPQAKFARITINTAAHIVYDESEGEHTMCHLFFDKNGTPETCDSVVALTGMVCKSSNTDSDYCRMEHYTHDLKLAKRLNQICKHREKLRRKIGAKLQEIKDVKCKQPTLDKQPLLFIVSHPHGCSKQISIGHWTSAREQPKGRHSYTYTTATCPGSSGAPVCLPHISTSIRTLHLYSVYTIHVGVLDEQPGLNFSIAYSDMDAQDTVVTLDTMVTSDATDPVDTPDTSDTLDTPDTSDTLVTSNKPETLFILDTQKTPDTLALSRKDRECQGTDTSDALTLARLDRENQGTWEAEYSYGGEADLHRHYDSCTKNPGHENFIPVDKFSIEDLPEEYRGKDVMDYIRAVSDLTVRVTVKYVSDKRPETNGVSGKPFPRYSYSGQRRTTVGTGWVEFVHVYHDDGRNTCRCKDCLASSKPQTEFGIICIRTASHVVYDESEAAHTTCHLYFDRGGTPETCEGVVALTGMTHESQYQQKDDNCMSHHTHDMGLAHRLHRRFKQRWDLQRQFWRKPPYIWKFKWSRPAPDRQPLLFVVSHPHGCSKQISIGSCCSLLPLTDKLRYTYTAATCPGSSGAGIHVLNEPVHQPGQIDLSGDPPLHHGVCDKQPGMNLSLLYKGWPVPEMVSQDVLGGDGGGASWEDILCAEEEVLCKHYNVCQLNPGHWNLFPADKFSVNYLPPCECKDDIMELIKVLSDLTVRVSMGYVSEERPETVPDTDIPYPWYRNRESNHLSVKSNQLRIGNGRITDVQFPDEVCECEECKNSDTPTEWEFALINIRTAAHLVYDKLDGKQTVCHLFFDSGETPDACQDVVTLTKARGTLCHTLEDECTMVYCTHDLVLAHKLKESVRLYQDLKRQCYRSYYDEIVKQNDRKNLTLNSPLYIVVSHPYGRAKHVSISYPGCHGNTDTEEILSPELITCPGSGGAPLIILGPQTLYPCLA